MDFAQVPPARPLAGGYLKVPALCTYGTTNGRIVVRKTLNIAGCHPGGRRSTDTAYI